MDEDRAPSRAREARVERAIFSRQHDTTKSWQEHPYGYRWWSCCPRQVSAIYLVWEMTSIWKNSQGGGQDRHFVYYNRGGVVSHNTPAGFHERFMIISSSHTRASIPPTQPVQAHTRHLKSSADGGILALTLESAVIDAAAPGNFRRSQTRLDPSVRGLPKIVHILQAHVLDVQHAPQMNPSETGQQGVVSDDERDTSTSDSGKKGNFGNIEGGFNVGSGELQTPQLSDLYSTEREIRRRRALRDLQRTGREKQAGNAEYVLRSWGRSTKTLHCGTFDSATVAQMALWEEERPLSEFRGRTLNGRLKEEGHWSSSKKRRPRKAAGKTVRDGERPAQMTPPAPSHGQPQDGSKCLTPSRWPDILATPSEGKTVNIIDDILDFERKRLDPDGGTVGGVRSNHVFVPWMNHVDTIDNDDSKGDGNGTAGQKAKSGLRADPEEVTLDDRQHGPLPPLSLLLSSSPTSSKPLSSSPSAPSPPLISSKRSSPSPPPSHESSVGSSAAGAKQTALGENQEGVAQAAVIGYAI